MLAAEFLEKHASWIIRDLEPVSYSSRDTWLATELKAPCAIVDFLYHSNAEFWADHHQTSMLNQAAEADFQQRRRKNCLFYDEDAKSCATLIYSHFRQSLSDKTHLRELVFWADKIDSAAYSSVKEAVLGDAAALRISRTLDVEKNEPEYARFLIRELRVHNLDYVAALDDVTKREERARRRILDGLQTVKGSLRLEPGNIAVVDANQTSEESISRYAPYYFAPDARYSIAVIRSPEAIRITAMRNPWRKFRSIALGRIFARFGGGGHERVGAVHLPVYHQEQAHEVVQRLLFQMQRTTG